jgi:hypothetical protein
LIEEIDSVSFIACLLQRRCERRPRGDDLLDDAEAQADQYRSAT